MTQEENNLKLRNGIDKPTMICTPIKEAKSKLENYEEYLCVVISVDDETPMPYYDEGLIYAKYFKDDNKFMSANNTEWSMDEILFVYMPQQLICPPKTEQIKEDELSDNIWICPKDGEYLINGHKSFIKKGMEYGFSDKPVIIYYEGTEQINDKEADGAIKERALPIISGFNIIVIQNDAMASDGKALLVLSSNDFANYVKQNTTTLTTP